MAFELDQLQFKSAVLTSEGAPSESSHACIGVQICVGSFVGLRPTIEQHLLARSICAGSLAQGIRLFGAG